MSGAQKWHDVQRARHQLRDALGALAMSGLNAASEAAKAVSAVGGSKKKKKKGGKKDEFADIFETEDASYDNENTTAFVHDEED